jgi:hypothetical protein
MRNGGQRHDQMLRSAQNDVGVPENFVATKLTRTPNTLTTKNWYNSFVR